MTHTPAPWSLVGKSIVVDVEGQDVELAELSPYFVEYAENGRLIIATPDLLWAAEWALERLIEEWGDEGALTECLRAVINKAKGEPYDPDAIGPWTAEKDSD